MANANPQPFTTFGELLKHLRLRAGLTQDEFGLAVGYSRAHVARLENGERLPDVTAVRSLFAEALRLKPDSEQAARLTELASAVRESSPARAARAAAEPPSPQIPSNLPTQTTRFFGREHELAHLRRVLETERLITLTGSGGVGKTRLGLELAGQVLERFPDGVWLVELAPLSDPQRVPQAIATVLGLHDETGRTLQQTVLDHLSAKVCLLVLDNCEHLIDACARFADAVLRAAPAVRVLASSREALSISGELAWRVPSLAVPEPGELVGVDDLGRFDGIRLFVDRAAHVAPRFMLGPSNADTVRQIVIRLDGIPLAIELAAARVRALPTEAIAERLNDRFRLLTGGSRTALPRQQTLRATIDWSHGLLQEAERVLLRRLSVFLGGFTLEAAESVYPDDDAGRTSVLDALTALVDKSLVQYTDNADAGRYWLLETIRQYAREKLIENEADAGKAVRDRHLGYFTRLGESLQPIMDAAIAGDQVAAMKRVDLEVENIREALEWALETGRIDAFWQLNESLLWFWAARSLFQEFIGRVSRFLRLPVPGADPYRARACLRLAYLRRDELAPARGYAENALAIGLALGDKDIQGKAYLHLATIEVFMGEIEQVRAHLAAAEVLVVDDDTTRIRAYIAISEGDYTRACTLWAGLHAAEKTKGHLVLSSALARHLGYAQVLAGELQEAGQSFRESLIDNAALSDRLAVAACLAAFGGLALAQGDLERSARLFAASDGLSEAIHIRIIPVDRTQYERNVAELRRRMEAAALEEAWKRGRAMTYQQAIDFALKTEPVSE